MLSPHLPEFYPIHVMDAVDEEVIDTTASLPSGNELAPLVTELDSATSGQEIPGTDTTETDAAGNCQQMLSTDPRGRVAGSAVVRGNAGSRSARGRIGGGGKPTSGEKSPGDEAAAGEGFTTDGRGRVIGTSDEVVWQGDDFRDEEAPGDHPEEM
jgi:hypothetical protein